MNHLCQIEGHDKMQITMLCSNPACNSKIKLICLRCLINIHQDCIHHVLEIEKILSGKLETNLNWIKQEDVRAAVKLINKYKLNNQVQVLDESERRIHEEFDKLNNFFLEKSNQAKEQVLANLKTRQNEAAQVNLKNFTEKMSEFYSFDTLVSIIENLKNNKENDLETVNVVLESFFASINQKKEKSSIELENKSATLGKYLTDVIELDATVFEKAKNTVSFKMFDRYLIACEKWTWNPELLQTGIELTENNMLAKKVGQGYNAVGTREFTEGHHSWELDIATGQGQAYWISFGIVDKTRIKANASFSYSQTVGVATDGTCYSMNKQRDPTGGYDKRTYALDLDMNNDNFTVSCGDEIIAETKTGLKGKTFLAYVYLYCVQDKALLRVTK